MHRQQGFSLPEVMVSILLMVLVVTALAGWQSQLASGFARLSQYRTLWRQAASQSQLHPAPPPTGWQGTRIQTSRQRCVSITANIVTPQGKQGQFSRLHCPKNQ